MADVDMAELPQTPRSTAGDDDLTLLDGEADLAAAILERLGGSPREDYQHLCATAAAMAQAVRDQGVDATPVAYFAAAAAALAPLARAGAEGADRHVAGALLAFLSAALPALPSAVVRSRGHEVANDVVRVLEFPSTPDSGVRAGLRCLAHLISAGYRANWETVEPLYAVILRLATDHRPKVRKQAHSCLRDVLQSFQRQAILVPASEGIARCFERFLLLAGGSSAVNTGVAEEGPKGAKEVLYILNGLKCCLPLMASKPSNTILKYFKALLDLHQLILTRNILEILNAVGESPTLQLKSDVLLDIMCSLGLSVSSERKSGDEMASIARLLHVGTKKVYNQNKDICIVKLPLVFTSLGDILSSEFEEARFSSVEAFKGLIDNCINETMVSKGIAQIKARHQGLKSDPTVIEKICAILEGLLDVRYSDVWDKSFHIISVAFDKLGEFSADLLPEALKNLADMQNMSDDDFSFRKQLNACIGSAVAAMGPKNVLEILQIRSICAENEWILPILEKHIVGASLQFFLKDILGIVKSIEKSINKLLKDDKLFSAKRAEGYVYSLWSLLPSCCNYPCDTSSNFRVLQSVLCDTLQNQPELRGIVCSSIQVLITQNKEALSVSREEDILTDDELSKSERRAKELYTKDRAEENLKSIRAFSSKLLDVLCSIFLTSSKDAIGLLQPAISEIASISDKDVVGKFFLHSIRKLLDATKAVNEEPVDDSSMQIETDANTNSMTRALLLDFAASLMPGLAAKSINVLFSYVKPAIKDSDSLIQKRAYKVLSMLLKDAEFVEKNLDVLLELMISSMPCSPHVNGHPALLLIPPRRLRPRPPLPRLAFALRSGSARPAALVMAFPSREALLVAVVALVVASAAAAAEGGGSVCFRRVFSFGDSLTDTGNFLLSVPDDFPDPARNLPYGQTFFGRPSGRYSDGRNLLDFFAEAFGLPFVPPYLGGGDFQYGANFAVGGATALNGSFFRERGVEPTWTPHSLYEQIQWFKKLLPSIAPSETERSDIMSNSLFFVGEVGGNDYNHLIVRDKSLDELHELVPNVVGAISSAITDLTSLGANKLVVPGNFPIGCVPLYLSIFPSQKEDYYDEQTGCIKWLNEFAEYHNSMLQEELERLRNLYPDVTIIYADYYGASLNIFRAPLQFGFTVPLNACCGSDAPYNCSPSILCGRPGSTVCSDPSKYISWDGLHFTEASYRVVIQGVLGGYAIPPLSETCKGGEFKVSQLHQCTDNPTNTVTYDTLSSFI